MDDATSAGGQTAGRATDLALPAGPEVTVRPLEFYSDGWKLSATLVAPAAIGTGYPALVWSHGWSGAVNWRVLPLAGRLAQAGYAGLVVDHRGFGGSEGARARCDPHEQVRDLGNAVTYLSQLDQVDANAVGVAGASFGGAIAIAAAANDSRVKACVSIVAMGNGERWLQGLRPFHEWYAVRQRLARDEQDRVAHGRGARVDLSELMPGPRTEAVEAEMELIRAKYPDGYPLENASLAVGFRPEAAIASISPRAVCVIGASDDTVVPVQESLHLFALAGEPKVLKVFPEGNHGGPLGPLVDQTASVVVSFLDRHLIGTTGTS